MADRPKGRKEPAPLGAILGSLFAGTPLGARLKESRIWLLWDETVGPTVAAKAQPVNFRDGILTVAVTSAPWLQQLNFMKRQLVSQLNEACGEQLVQEIFLKAGSRQREQEMPPTRPVRCVANLTPERIAEIAALSGDPELARIFAHLLDRDRTSS
jgi:predicted nucleic acid-binding Zn ribbon protein